MNYESMLLMQSCHESRHVQVEGEDDVPSPREKAQAPSDSIILRGHIFFYIPDTIT